MTPTQENDKKVPHMDSWKCIILSAVSEEEKGIFLKKNYLYESYFIAMNKQCAYWFIAAASILVSWFTTSSSIIMMLVPRAILQWEIWHIQRYLWNICFKSSLLIWTGALVQTHLIYFCYAFWSKSVWDNCKEGLKIICYGHFLIGVSMRPQQTLSFVCAAKPLNVILWDLQTSALSYFLVQRPSTGNA